MQEIVLRTVRLPLVRPYVLSYRTFTEFEPIIVEVRDADARVGWGEGHISPGSSSETRDGGWTFCREHAAAVIGKDSSEAKAIIARDPSPQVRWRRLRSSQQSKCSRGIRCSAWIETRVCRYSHHSIAPRPETSSGKSNSA